MLHFLRNVLATASLLSLATACSSGGGKSNAAPVFSSPAAVNLPENDATAYTAVATDADGELVTFGLTGGADFAAFTIDPNSGVLTFFAAPDFEVPADSGLDNTYDVIVSATDGVATTTLDVSISITNIVNEFAPVFVSGASASTPEGGTLSGYTALAIDADLDAVTYSLSGGLDQTKFAIDSISGVLSFLVATDFETPTDSDGDNDYEVQIAATDTVYITYQSVTISVTDVLEVVLTTPGVNTVQLDWTAVTGATFYRLLVDPDGASGFSIFEDSIVGTSTSMEVSVHLMDWTNARYQLEAHDPISTLSASLAFAVTSEMVGSIGYFKPSVLEIIDQFGTITGISGDGNTIAVTAVGEDSGTSSQADNSAASAGAVYIFVRSGNTWMEQAFLKPAFPTKNTQFGRGGLRFSTDGDTLAIGAPFEDSAASGVNGDESSTGASNAGAAYIFVRVGTTWSQEAYLKASTNGPGDRFGLSTSISSDGNTLAVGADEEASSATGIGGDETDNSMLRSGAAYVFTRSAGTWTQQAYIKASNPGADHHFGVSVALAGTGDTLAIGANSEASSDSGVGANQADTSALGTGAVYVFTRSGVTWTQQEYIKAAESDQYDGFGDAVSISEDGNTLAVGAGEEDSSSSGINGNQTSDNMSNAGAAYVFVRAGATWTQEAYVKASNPGNSDVFGTFLSLSRDGNTLVVTSMQEDSDAVGIGGTESDAISDAGAAYAFVKSGGTWAQVAYMKSTDSDANDFFGTGVAVSADGSTIVIGADGERGSSTGIGGDASDDSLQGAGAVYVY